MRLWKCWNPKCADKQGIPGHDFTSEDHVGTCDKCGLKSDDARFGKLIVPRVVIHFDAPSGIVEGAGVNYAACSAEFTRTKGYRMSGEPVAVNCPLCRETEVFKKHDHDAKLHPDYDVPVEIKQDGSMVLQTK